MQAARDVNVSCHAMCLRLVFFSLCLGRWYAITLDKRVVLDVIYPLWFLPLHAISQHTWQKKNLFYYTYFVPSPLQHNPVNPKERPKHWKDHLWHLRIRFLLKHVMHDNY
jgi:hypothetical protein